MAYAYPGDGSLDYYPCRYGNSRLVFRGPTRDLNLPFVVALGGTETYGKFVPEPFSNVVEANTGLRMVNLGCMNAGIDVYLKDPDIMHVARRARLAVVQVMGAQNLTNRFYAVHPRRNDRFLHASPLLRAMFRDVDFTEFNFTGHMLQTLQSVSADKFEVLAEELRAAWVARMKALLAALPCKTVLLWMSDTPPRAPGCRADLTHSPMMVDAEMIGAVRGQASAYVEAIISPKARASRAEGMAFAELDGPAAQGLPGPAAHREVAATIGPVLAGLV
jgi:hypothetical protein